jgi:hypothetical protein
MKYLICFLLVALFTNSVNAQNDQASNNFIRKVIIPRNDEKIIYCDSVNSYAIDEIKRALFNAKYKTGFVLSKKEKVHVRSELKKMKGYVWQDSLMQNCTLIKKDSINYAFGKSNKSLIDGWGYFHDHFGEGYYDFSKPIFIRNNTVCIFYKGHHCGWLCGDGVVAVYIKRGNKWIFKYGLSSWIS